MESSPIFLHFKHLMDDSFISPIQPKHYHGTDYHFVTYVLTPCQHDIYIYCKYGMFNYDIIIYSNSFGYYDFKSQ
jgi:hypothetical protein